MTHPALLSLLLQVSIPAKSLQDLLDNLYNDMLPLCSSLINVGRALGGLGALVYIAGKVWRSQAAAEPIDVFPLLRPFAIGLVIALFPTMLGVLNGVLGGISTATSSIVTTQNQSIIQLQERKKALLAARPENAPYESDDAFDKELESKDALDFGGKAALYFNRMSYDVQKNFREWMRNVLELAYQSAALVINTIRTFFLIILSIIGKIQVLMLNMDINQIQSGGDLESADMGYMIFLVIAIAGYFTVPSVAGWIVSASGMTNITRFATNAGGNAASMAAGAAGGVAGQVAGRAIAVGRSFAGGGASSSGAEGSSGYKNTAA